MNDQSIKEMMANTDDFFIQEGRTDARIEEMKNKYGNKMLIVSTPSGRENWLYTEWLRHHEDIITEYACAFEMGMDEVENRLLSLFEKYDPIFDEFKDIVNTLDIPLKKKDTPGRYIPGKGRFSKRRRK